MYLALQRCLQKDGVSEEKLTKVSARCNCSAPSVRTKVGFLEDVLSLFLFLPRWCPNSQ